MTDSAGPRNNASMDAHSQIPKGWGLVSLSEVVSEFLGGGTPSTKEPRFWDGDIPWTTSAHIEGLYVTRGAKAITSLGLQNSSSSLVPARNVLVGTRVGVGKVAVNTIAVAISQDLTGLVLRKERVDERFLTFAIMSPAVQSHILARMRGTTIKGIPRDDLATIPIPLPPLPEQRAIASVLSAVRRAIETTEAVIEATEQLRRSLTKTLFLHGPTDHQDRDRVPVRETGIGPLPDTWGTATLAELFRIQQGKALSPAARIGISPVPFLRTSNVMWGKIALAKVDEMDFTPEEVNKLSLEDGDLLVCEGGDVGRSAVWRRELPTCCFQNHLHRLRARSPDVNPAFFMYWLWAAFLLFGLYSGQANRTTIANLSQARLGSFEVPFPDRGVQDRIVAILDAVANKVQAEVSSKSALEVLFASLLESMMTGAIRVPVG